MLAVYTKLTCGVQSLPFLNGSRLNDLALQTRVASNKFGIRNGEGQALALRFAGGNCRHPPLRFLGMARDRPSPYGIKNNLFFGADGDFYRRFAVDAVAAIKCLEAVFHL